MRDKKLLVSEIELITGILPLFVRLILFIVVKIRISRMQGPIACMLHRMALEYRCESAEAPSETRQLFSKRLQKSNLKGRQPDRISLLRRKLSPKEIPPASAIGDGKTYSFLGSRAIRRTSYQVRIAHPSKLSKGGSDSTFLVQIYPSEHDVLAEKDMQDLSENLKTKISKNDTSVDLKKGNIEIELESPNIDFKNNTVKTSIGDKLTRTYFLGHPKQNAPPGNHAGLLRIREDSSQLELVSLPFKIVITDYVFDHVPRLFLGTATGIIGGIGSFAVIIFTALGYIDQAFGFQSGTVGIFIIGFLFRHLHINYKQQKSGLPSSFSIEQKA